MSILDLLKPGYVNLFALLLLVSGSATVFAEDLDQSIVARVGGQVISLDDYKYALNEGLRQKFYHGSIPAAEMIEFRHEIANQLIERAMLSQQARSRGLKPDDKNISMQISQLVSRYQNMQGWQENKDRVIAVLKQDLENRDLTLQLEQQVKSIPDPEQSDLEDYYQNNQEKFTVPAQDHLWVILLKVAPYAEPEEWDNTLLRAKSIHQQLLENPQEFEAIAKANSNDPSAVNGGDLGFIHQGMLSEEALEALSKVEMNEITVPVLLLEGYGLFKRSERLESNLKPLSEVRERAMKLLVREMQESTWSGFKDSLRSRTDIQIYESHYLSAEQ
jgi:parvulin-like peptidyl-prolyl isomerase